MRRTVRDTLQGRLGRVAAVAHTLLVPDLTELAEMRSLAIGQFVALQRAVQRRGGRITIVTSASMPIAVRQ